MDNKQIIRKIYEECLNKNNIEPLNQLIADEYEGLYGKKGAEGFMQTINMVRGAFPDIQWHIEDLIAADDKVVIRWTWKGTHKGPLGNMPATGKSVNDKGIAIYQINDGKVIKSWVETDRFGLMQQLGAAGQSGMMSGPGK